jgi:TolB protein
MLLVGALAMFAVAIGVNISAPGNQSASSTEDSLAVDTPSAAEEERQPSISPISPLSLPVALEPNLTPRTARELQLTGCLLFVSNRSGDFEIYLQENGLSQLTNTPGLDIEPAWSPDGSQIAFVSNRGADVGLQIYLMTADGSNQKRLGEVQPGDNTHPSWSPDGSQIVFQSKRDINSDPGDDNWDLYVMSSDGSKSRPIANSPADDTEPRWSPDGRKIAFLSERSGQDEIYVIDPDGSHIEQLTDLMVLKSGLNWSSNGQWIIFEGSGDIYIVNVETKEVTKLIVDENSNEATPAWAEKDKLVLFSSDRTGNWELYALDMSDPNGFLLYDVIDDPGIDRSPDWSSCN